MAKQKQRSGKWIMAKLGVCFLTWRRRCQRAVQPYGITLKQCYVLNQLKRKGVLRPSQVADMLFCDRPTATVVLRNMKRQGWIDRKADPDDGRQALITLAPAGRRKLEELGTHKPDGFDPLSCFNAQERQQLASLLGRLEDHLVEERKMI